MRVTIDPRSTVPPYDQIRSQIETMAVSGVLAAGTRLPSIRQLAGDLALAPATVARAFSELERAGVVETRRGRGTVVVGPGRRPSRAQAHSELRAAADAFMQRAKQLGVSRKAALDAIAQSTFQLDD